MVEALVTPARTGPVGPVNVTGKLKATVGELRQMSSRKKVNSAKDQYKKLLVASLLLAVRPGAPSSVLAPSSDALCS